MASYSIIFVSSNPYNVTSSWLEQQKSEQVEVIKINWVDNAGAICKLLNQAIEQANGDYIALIDESLKVQTPQWLDILSNHYETCNYQILGIAGFEKLVNNSHAAKVVWPAYTMAINGQPLNASPTRSYVKDVVLTDGRCIFARREIFRQYPLIRGDNLPGVNILANVLFQHQLHLTLEAGLSQGIIAGLTHSIAEDSPWSEQSLERLYCHDYFRHFLPMDALQAAIWRYNLQAIRCFDSQAADQLLFMLSQEQGYQFQYRTQNRLSAVNGDKLALIADRLDQLESIPEGDTYVICGVGSGVLIQKLLEKPEHEVLVLEPESGLLGELLKYFDWSDALSSGRLRILPLAAGSDIIEEISLNQVTRNLQILLDRSNLVTHVIRGYSYHLHTDWFRRIEQGLLQYIEQRKEARSWLQQRQQNYDVTVISPQCQAFSNLADCFQSLGLRTRLFNIHKRSNQLTLMETRDLLKQLAVDGSKLTISRNRSFFETENVRKGASFERYLQGNIINWWWEKPEVASFIDFYEPQAEVDHIGCSQAMLPLLPENAICLSPGANTRFCQPRDPSENWLFEVSFVGQSHIPVLQQHLQLIAEFVINQCGETLRESVIELLSYCHYRQLYLHLQGFEKEFYQILQKRLTVMPAQVYYFDSLYALAKAMVFRLAAIETLFIKGRSVAVFGDSAWVESGIVPKQHFHGTVDSADKLLGIYQTTKLNLDLNLNQPATMGSQVFDVLASNSLVLTTYQPEQDAFFAEQGLQLPSFHQLDQLEATVDQALQLVEAGLATDMGKLIRDQHTLLHRAQWLVDHYLPSR